MTRSAKALWLVLLLNAAMVVGVAAFGAGNVPFSEYREPLKWFGLGVFLAAIALALANVSGVDAVGEGRDLEDVPPRFVRMIMGIVGFGVLAGIAFAEGVISTLPLLGS